MPNTRSGTGVRANFREDLVNMLVEKLSAQDLALLKRASIPEVVDSIAEARERKEHNGSE